jgi:hypothetical protein
VGGVPVNLRTTILAIATLGLLASALTAPLAGAETEIPGKQPDNCTQVYLFYEEGRYATVDGSDGCPSVIVHDEQACQDLADTNTLLEHEGDCEFKLNTGPFQCGPDCPFPIGDGASV